VSQLSFVIIFVVFVPFLIAHAMPNKKWLIAYLLAFSTTISLICYALLESLNQPLSNGKDLPGRGIGEGITLLLLYVFLISGISGVISKAIFFYVNSRFFSVPKWFNFLAGIMSIVLTSLLSIGIVQGLVSLNGVERKQRLEPNSHQHHRNYRLG
jgi:hypothetical protein